MIFCGKWTSLTSMSYSPYCGLTMDTSDHQIDNLMEWERKFESADLVKHKQFLQEAKLSACDNPLEAIAWENGFVPEARGIPSEQLELRIQGSLPPLAYMVSRPRQPTTTREELLRRYDAGVRPYWLRDWQSGFGGYTKVYEYQVQWGDRTEILCCSCGSTTNPVVECLSKMPDHKPWKRTVGTRDPSRGVLLDLQENCEWTMGSTVMLPKIDPITVIDDNMQAQCLPVFGSDQPKWTYWKVPKVTAFRTVARLPFWARKPQKFTYHVCAEDITRSTIVPTLPEEERSLPGRCWNMECYLQNHQRRTDSA